MSVFTNTQFEFFNYIAISYKEASEDTVELHRGTLLMTITKRTDGLYDVLCTDEKYNLCLRKADKDLEAAVRKALKGYMGISAAVRQTCQFILNAEEGIAEFHKKTGKYAI